MIWKLIWTRPARKDLNALDPVSARRVHHSLRHFSETGRGDIARVVNAKAPRRRIRVGPYRIIIRENEDLGEVEIIRIHRRDAAY